jgi:hypothetical protein
MLKWTRAVDNERRGAHPPGLCRPREGAVKDDAGREREKGLSLWYLWDAAFHRARLGSRHHTPGFGHAAALFSVMARNVLEKLGPEEGGELIRKAVDQFGFERGVRIASLVRSLGKPTTFKNWLIYSDIDGSNFKAMVWVEGGELVARVKGCTFMAAARQWGLGDYASHYCATVDHAILRGYNPDIRLKLESRTVTGKDYCLFRYGVRAG